MTWSLVVSRSNWCRRLISCTQAWVALAIAGVFKLCVHSWQATFPLLTLFFPKCGSHKVNLFSSKQGLKCREAIIVCGNARNEGVAAVVESRCDIRPEPEARCNCPTSTSLVLHSNPLPIFRNPSAMPQYGHNLPCMISPLARINNLQEKGQV